MCGIVGYVGYREAEPVLLEGLRRLEYRGYDSAGVATLTGPRLHIRKKAGRIADLSVHLAHHPAPGRVGIGHTRWATHGPATDHNAHPHIGGDDLVAVVHNGVIANYAALRRQLQDEGVVFRSATDTEVIAHLIARHLQARPSEGELVEAVRRVLPLLKGTYGLAVLSRREPNVLVGARLGSPLVLGVGSREGRGGECFLASDPSALAGYAQKVVYLDDGQVCLLGPGDFAIQDRRQGAITPAVHALDSVVGDFDPGPYEHHMLKEIYEQPEALHNALRSRLDLADGLAHFGGLNLDSQQLRQAERLILTACGTSYHAALVGEYLFEEFARLPVEVEYTVAGREPLSPHG